MTPNVSLLIPTLNRHEILIDTLKGLLLQTYRPLEIVVYDQTATHPTAVTDFLEKHRARIRWERGTPNGLVNAYARCAELATGDLFLFLDDDVLIDDPQLVDKHVAALSNQKNGAAIGRILHENQQTFSRVDPRIERQDGWRFVRFDYDSPVENMPSLAGANMSVSRVVFEQIGGFDRNYQGSGFRFETDFCMKIRAAGYRIPFLPEASLVHRYHSAGGASNSHLESMSATANEWYRPFFHNTFYFLFKWHSPGLRLKLSGRIWREHAFNRAIFKQGIRQVWRRNAILLKELKTGIRLARKVLRD